MSATTPPRAPTRDRVLFTAAELFRRQGYAGTGLKQIATAAEAPFGSIYHHFPAGKEQLAEEVLRTGGAFFGALYEAVVADEPDVVAGVRAFFRGAGETLVATDYLDACPIATVAGEIASTHDALRRACADVFESWIALLVADLRAVGVAEPRARELGFAVLSTLEGAFLLSRTLRSVEPMRAAGAAAVRLIEEEVTP
jgi:AcrR family transcriptional regulator